MTNLHLFRLQISTSMTATAIMFTGAMKCGAPTLVGVTGTASAEPSRRLSVVGLEWPEHFGVSNIRVEREMAIAARADVDLRRDGKTILFGATQSGPDPPDLVASLDGATRGVEVTQLVVADRVRAAEAFRSVRAAVLREYARKFNALKGYVVYVSVHTGNWIPEGEKVTAALAAYTPSKERFEGGLPENLSGFVEGQGEGFSVTAAKLDRSPNSSFFDAMGFELVLCFTTEIDERKAWEEVVRRATGNHDKPGVQDLLISAGAPIATGWAFPSDGVMGSLALGVARTTAVVTNHIERIFVHLWPWRAVFQLTPGVSGYVQLCGDENFLDVVPPSASTDHETTR